MKKQIFGLSLFLAIAACRKSTTEVISQPPAVSPKDTIPAVVVKTDTASAKQTPFPQAPVTGCSYDPSYGDSIIFPQPVTNTDYIVSPVNNPPAGKYYAWPVGMVIDSVTGAIDVTQSQTGMRYAIGFVKSGSTDTCLSTLIIGGVDYMDSVYVLASGATTAAPYYDANPYLPSVCNGSGNGCTFDVTGSAARQKVIVNNSTGVIDLAKTLNGTTLLGGAFGLLPINGQTITTTIYYKLNDASNNALQHIDVQIAYYNSKSLINIGLVNNVLNRLDNILSGNIISLSANPRPPLIIIVRQLQ